MIDLHCHVLPGIDDGPATDEDSIELLGALQADGAETVAATPHLRSDFPAVKVAELRDRVARLEEAARGRPSPVIVPAAEVSLPWAIEASDDDLRLASFGQRGEYLLVEAPYGPASPRFDESLRNLRLRGLRILLAHPERNPSYQQDPKRLAALVARGTLVQVNASSILSTKRGSRSRQLAFALLREGLAHVIASDAHSVGWRPPMLTAAATAAERAVGPRAHWMLQDVPAAVLAGADVPAPPAGKGRAAFGFLRGRRARAAR